MPVQSVLTDAQDAERGTYMVEILQNKANTEKIEFNASENGKSLGKCAGVLMGDTFVFDELECDEFFVDGLVRAILNLMDLHGIEKARFDFGDGVALEMLKRWGFVKNDEKTIGNIAQFFSENKKCTKM